MNSTFKTLMASSKRIFLGIWLKSPTIGQYPFNVFNAIPVIIEFAMAASLLNRFAKVWAGGIPDQSEQIKTLKEYTLLYVRR
jgi:hypothetical protein